jgi:hypothetical protein
VPGTYTITVMAKPQSTAGGWTYFSTAPATVTPLSIALGGTFVLPAGVPTSPSGAAISGQSSVTIVGTAPAGWQVEVVAPPRGIVGIATAGPDGRFEVATVSMGNGAFSFSLVATNPAADALGSKLVLQAPVGTLIIDTTAPRVQAVHLNRRAGEILITFLDSGAGLDPTGLFAASSYGVSLGSAPQTISSVLDFGPTAKPGTRQIALVLNGGRRLGKGRYVLTIRASAIQDLAGLALDGEFRGRLPSGNGAPGGDFRARIDSRGRLMPLATGTRRTRARHGGSARR